MRVVDLTLSKSCVDVQVELACGNSRSLCTCFDLLDSRHCACDELDFLAKTIYVNASTVDGILQRADLFGFVFAAKPFEDGDQCGSRGLAVDFSFFG